MNWSHCLREKSFWLSVVVLLVGIIYYIRVTQRPPKIKCLVYTALVVAFYMLEIPMWLIGVLMVSVMIFYNWFYQCQQPVYGFGAIILTMLISYLPKGNCFIALLLALSAYIGLAWYDEFAVCFPKLSPTGSFISRIQAPFKPESYRI